MNKPRDYLPITKPILVFCIILILFVLVSCVKSKDNKTTLNVNKTSSVEKTLVGDNEYDYLDSSSSIFSKTQEKQDVVSFNSMDYENSDIKNLYYGKYSINNDDIFGNFEITRNSIIFTPSDGNSREIIHFSGMKNIDKIEYPNGKIDLILEYDGYEKVIKNVNNEMFSEVLLYTAK